MDTRKKLKRTLVKRKLRRRHSRNKNHKRFTRKRTSSILPIILVLLLIFNIGTFLYLIKSGNLSKDITLLDLFLETLNIGEISAEKPKTETSIEPSPEDYDGYRRSENKVIEHLEEYENFIVVEEGGVNLENIPDPINVEKFTVDKDKDYILAYHTHTTESFLVDDLSYHNNNPSDNIVAIGETLSTILRANGHKVNHDITVHDLPSYNQSYSRSKSTITKNLEENPNLKVMLDIHRDGRDKDDPNLDKFIRDAKIDIDGISTATFSLVVGPDAENYKQLLSFAKYIKATSDTMYPGLCQGIIIKPIGKYNLQFSDYSVLLELGSNWVTIEETRETAKRVGEILSAVLNKLIE